MKIKHTRHSTNKKRDRLIDYISITIKHQNHLLNLLHGLVVVQGQLNVLDSHVAEIAADVVAAGAAADAAAAAVVLAAGLVLLLQQRLVAIPGSEKRCKHNYVYRQGGRQAEQVSEQAIWACCRVHRQC
jgi:hypothetical protein